MRKNQMMRSQMKASFNLFATSDEFDTFYLSTINFMWNRCISGDLPLRCVFSPSLFWEELLRKSKHLVMIDFSKKKICCFSNLNID